MYTKNCFDFLRFFFAANVVLSHLGELSQNENLSFLSHFFSAIIGVKGFFVISGFLVAKSYVNTASLKHYFVKRAKRILPAYVVVIVLSIIVLAFFSRYSIAQYFSDSGVYQYLGWNLIFLNFMHPCLPGLFESNFVCAVNGALWTLKIEEGFYIVLPLIFYCIKKSKKAFLMLVSLYVLSILYWLLMDFYLNKPLLAKQLPGYLCYFVTGIMLFLNFSFMMKNRITLALIAIVVLFLFHYSNMTIGMLYPAAFGILVIIAAYSFSFFNNFGKYGDFTYGIYIYHFPIIQLLRQYNWFEKYNPFAVSFGAILLTLFFAVLSWFVVEKRFLDRFKNNSLKQVEPIC